jgi:hypothetical protein
MARCYGKIGYAIDTETRPGVWSPVITEKDYSGETVRDTRQRQTSDGVNDNLNVANRISIIGNIFANENFQSMLYIEFMGAKWKITSVEVLYPRLILTAGGIYSNGNHS